MFGHQREIVDAKNYNNIRLLNIDRVTSDKPLYDIVKIITPWAPPAETFQNDIKCKLLQTKVCSLLTNKPYQFYNYLFISCRYVHSAKLTV